MIYLEFGGHARGEIVQNDIYIPNEVIERGKTALTFQINTYAFFISVERYEIRALPVMGVFGVISEESTSTLSFERLYLYGLCAHICQEHSSIGAGQHMRQVKNPNTFERFGHFQSAHCCRMNFYCPLQAGF